MFLPIRRPDHPLKSFPVLTFFDTIDTTCKQDANSTFIDSDDASDENGRRNGRSPASTTSDNDFDRGNLNNSDDAEDSEDVTEGPDTHPADDSVTDNVDADAIAREDRGPDELPPTVTVLDGQHGSKVRIISLIN